MHEGQKSAKSMIKEGSQQLIRGFWGVGNEQVLYVDSYKNIYTLC